MGNQQDKLDRREQAIEEGLADGSMVYGKDGLLYKNNISKSRVMQLYDEGKIDKATMEGWNNPKTSTNPAGVSIRKEKWEEFKANLGSGKPRQQAYHDTLNAVDHAADTTLKVVTVVTGVGALLPPPPSVAPTNSASKTPPNVEPEQSVQLPTAAANATSYQRDTDSRDTSTASVSGNTKNTWSQAEPGLQKVQSSVEDVVTVVADPYIAATKVLGAIGKADAKNWCDTYDMFKAKGCTDEEALDATSKWERFTDR